MHKMATKFNPQNGREVVKYAKEKGAKIEQKKNGMVKISTPSGSMQVEDNKHNYSEHDKSNIRRWLKLLGLLLLFLLFVFLILPHMA